MSYEPIDKNHCASCYLIKEGKIPYCKSEGKYWKCNKCGAPLGRCEIINDWCNKWGCILCTTCYETSMKLGINNDNLDYIKWHFIPKTNRHYRMIRL